MWVGQEWRPSPAATKAPLARGKSPPSLAECGSRAIERELRQAPDKGKRIVCIEKNWDGNQQAVATYNTHIYIYIYI